MGQRIVPKRKKIVEKNEFSFNGRVVEVERNLTLTHMKELLLAYFVTYVTIDENTILNQFPLDPFGAQIEMDGKLFELVTNIKSESKHFDFDELYGSKLIAEVKSNIDNWPVFKEILGEYRAMVNAETFSLKGVISSFMSEIGEDKIKDIAKQAQELTEKIQESPIGSLVEESKNEKKNI